MLRYERQAKKQGYQLVIGVDEAGRGPLAGPVVAAAVALQKTSFRNKIQDSKKLTPLQRECAFHEIYDKAYVGVGIMSESVIDQYNILQATFQAMALAVRRLLYDLARNNSPRSYSDKDICILVDGNSFKTDLQIDYRTIIDGDALSLSIACASIVAKVTRDRILCAYDKIFPQYGLAKHKGYPTRSHREALEKYGPSMIHRKSFSWVKP